MGAALLLATVAPRTPGRVMRIEEVHQARFKAETVAPLLWPAGATVPERNCCAYCSR